MHSPIVAFGRSLSDISAAQRITDSNFFRMVPEADSVSFLNRSQDSGAILFWKDYPKALLGEKTKQIESSDEIKIYEISASDLEYAFEEISLSAIRDAKRKLERILRSENVSSKVGDLFYAANSAYQFFGGAKFVTADFEIMNIPKILHIMEIWKKIGKLEDNSKLYLKTIGSYHYIT